MYKFWIFFTIVSIVFFLSCLVNVIYWNRPVFDNLAEEGSLIVAIINLAMSYNYYRHNKDLFAAKRKNNNK